MSDEKQEAETPIEPAPEPEQPAPAKVYRPGYGHGRRKGLKPGHTQLTAAQKRKGLERRQARSKVKAELVAEMQAEPDPIAARFGIDPELVADLSVKEIEELWQRALFEASIERGKAKKQEVRERLLIRARRQLGMTTAADEQKAHRLRMREPLSITLNLAEYTASIVLDGRVFLHGHTYTVPRSVYETLADQMAQTWRHQAELDGKRRNYYNQQRGWLEHGGGRPNGSGRWAA